jgi:hypothetical protein
MVLTKTFSRTVYKTVSRTYPKTAQNRLLWLPLLPTEESFFFFFLCVTVSKPIHENQISVLGVTGHRSNELNEMVQYPIAGSELEKDYSSAPGLFNTVAACLSNHWKSHELEDSASHCK